MASEQIRKSLWRCPKCGHRFVTRNLWHSCGCYSLTDHFKGKPKSLRETFNQFVRSARAFGRVTVYAQKTRIVLQSRVRFASAVVHRDWLEANLWLKRRIQHPLLYRTEDLRQLGYYFHFCLRAPGEIDANILEWIQEAYAIRQRE